MKSIIVALAGVIGQHGEFIHSFHIVPYFIFIMNWQGETKFTTNCIAPYFLNCNYAVAYYNPVRLHNQEDYHERINRV
ncbi:TPA: hypothetical protein MIM87_15265 [Klebsiella variicola]|uniref:Uncharacterized protein n=1 Tax=Klebsiella variicola (strain 342) TaxID=507522 RepID=B5Y327_KLEV3|nr:hypothetical protein KPK_5093 [Klebsiella variicola]PKJ64449.1 hypothetical protein CW266_13640 [Klebsiella sp. T11]AWX79315.1 hypothetical protein DQB70_25210 [Klebsiella variicola]MBW5920385.1 hypothetical protein [Klebsiella variicola]PLC77231.1 hypothetical protein B6I40_14325 [Klebsiella variicola]